MFVRLITVRPGRLARLGQLGICVSSDCIWPRLFEIDEEKIKYTIKINPEMLEQYNAPAEIEGCEP